MTTDTALSIYMNTHAPLIRGDSVGIINGLIVCDSQRGNVLPFAATAYCRDSGFAITTHDQMGGTMRGSISIATSWLKANAHRYNVRQNRLEGTGLQLGTPTMGAKNGPSAGAAILSVCLSSLTKRLLRSDIAVTGEIDEGGRIRRIGGLKQKLEGALHKGVSTVIIPEENAADLTEATAQLKASLRIVRVKRIEDVLEEMFSARPLQLTYKLQ